MRNPFFHFQQFSLRQDHSAMKVCTDSCVFGAWTAARMGDARRVLDIGTGTGLLTLMLAQQKQAAQDVCFEAIELHRPSCDEAANNFACSPWPEKIRLHYGDVRTFSFSKEFDFVIVNPPFYENQLPSPVSDISNARHETSLNFAELLSVLKRVLCSDGKFSILLPAERENEFCGLAEDKGYMSEECCRLKQTAEHDHFRSLMLFKGSSASDQKTGANYRSAITEIIIRDNAGQETPGLLGVMQNYYIR